MTVKVLLSQSVLMATASALTGMLVIALNTLKMHVKTLLARSVVMAAASASKVSALSYCIFIYCCSIYCLAEHFIPFLCLACYLAGSDGGSVGLISDGSCNGTEGKMLNQMLPQLSIVYQSNFCFIIIIHSNLQHAGRLERAMVQLEVSVVRAV